MHISVAMSIGNPHLNSTVILLILNHPTKSLHKPFNLNSTVILLISAAQFLPCDCIPFKFHCDSINIGHFDGTSHTRSRFKFHCDSINIVVQTAQNLKESDLNSTVILLISVSSDTQVCLVS